MYALVLVALHFFGYNGISGEATEFPLTATSGRPFICTDGTEVELSKVCNGLPDCSDSSDELRKLCHHVVCPTSNFRCSYGACIQKSARCNGFQDCVDGSDEFLCELSDVCSDREYRCLESLECVQLDKICNGYVDCKDGSDEIETLCKDYPCPSSAYHCDYGGCVHQETICDGTKDCVDGSDEEASMCASINCQGDECQAYVCKDNEFSCHSGGQCIPATKLCDGSYQCRDASDEKLEICSNRGCNTGFFRCSYGGCISESLTCNLQPNCHDWSDEDESICGPSFPEGACRLPPARPGTHYLASNCEDCRPGRVVPELTRLDFTCDVVGSLEGSSSVYCQDNRWVPTLPSCVSDAEGITCSPIVAPGAKKRCEVLWGPRQGWIDCNGLIPVGTRVTLECPEFYERETGASHTTCLHDGTWSQLPLRCRPTCGTREASAAALIVKGWELDPEDALPWHATLFSHDNGNWNFFCGGTLIAERAVLTAGHCVWKTDEKTIRVVLAGFSSNFTHRDEDTQIFEVESIHLQKAYHDHEGNYGSDLAVLVLDRPALIDSVVKPACLDWDNSLDVSQRSGEIGLVAGMGITENDTFSSRLRVTSVMLVSEDACRESQTRDFRKYLTYTTLCAGWLNGTAVCNGDSGGGLVLARPNSTIWDVHGVVSISPRRIGTSICDPYHYTVFTKQSMTLTHKMSSKSSLKYSSSTMKIQARISTRSLVQRGAPKNHEILAVTAPTKLAELGQIPDQKTTTKSTEIRDIFNSLDVRHGTIQDDVVITPSYMEFKDASEGMVFRQSMTIRNIGKMPALVRICEPNSIALKIKSQRKGVILCPGLVLTRWVTYTFKRPALLHATIPIEINARTLNYRIVCSLSTEFIAIDPPSLDFGTVDIGCTSSTKIITISNIGGKSTRFTVDLGKNEKEMNVKPRRGLARPYSKIQLHVEIVGVVEGDFCGEFWIKSSPNIGVPVKVKVIVPRLVVHYPNSTGDFTLVDFPPTFMNARRYDSLVLRNISSRVTSYVVLAEIGNKLVPLKDVDHVENPAYSVFKINAMEGRLEPFEGRILNIEFSPTAKAARKPTVASTSGSREFIAFVRVLRVHCTEIEDIIKAEAKTEPSADYPPPKKIHIQEDAKSNSTVVEFAMSSPGRIAMETVRLCVHGEYESAKLCFTPDEIYLENFEYGATEKRVVRIQNPSRSNAVKFRFVDNGNAHTQPSEGWLDPGKAVEILVTIGAKRTWVENKVKLGFDVIARSCSARASRQQIDVKVATFYLNCYVNYREQKSTKTVEKIISDRYSPEPDYTMTFTEEERATEKNHKQYWANYLRTLHNREMRLADSEKLRSKCDCFEDLDEFLLNALEVPKSKNFRTLDAQLQCEPAEGKLSKEKKDKTLIPLSPLQIYNVKVSPTMLVFGSVVMKSLDYRELRFENKNSFSVKMRLLSFSRKNLRFPTGDTIILNPDTVTKKLVEFWAEQTGRFNGYIDYVINDHHPFELTVTADVVYKSLTLGAREVVLGSEEYHALGESYRPLSGRVEVKNKLNARTHFKWSVPASAGFVVSPRTGYVRGRRNLYVSIAYVGDTPKSQNSEAIIVTEGGTYMTLKMSTVLPVPDVAFLNDTLNVGLIPLNVPYAAVGVLHNAGYNEVIFEVNQASVGHGWFVYPMRGIIPPRGIALVEVQLRFEVCLNFAIFVEVTIHKGPKLRLKITGEVSFPMLKLSPRNITTPRMSADGSQSYHLSATNFGKTLLTLSFPLENYPEFRVSLSATQQPLSLESQGIIVLPGNTRSLYLHFKPVDLTSYAFYLPVVVNEILGPAVVENPKSLDPQEYLSPNEGWFIGSKNMNIVQPPSTLPTVFIDCTVTAYLLAFNKLTFNLDATTGELEDVLRVNNKATKDTSFIIRIDELIEKNCPFTIQHVRGAQADFVGVSIVCTLQPGASVEFRIKFNPQGRHDDFSVEAPIFVRGELDGGVFSTLRLEGRNPKCSIVSDTLEIYFRPLPLKVEAEEKFELLATNFIKCSKITVDVVEPDRLVGEFRENLLTVTFPRGSTIEGNIKRSEVIEVCLAFSSESPVSFRAKLRFHDAKNVASFIVTVFATADNCLLTIHSYLRSSSSGCKKNRFKLWDSSHPSLESQVSENCSLDKEFSGGKERRFIYAKPRLSAHSTASQSSWNASKIFNSMRVKPSASKYPNDEEDDEELEVTSRFDGSEMSASSRRPSKTFRVSGFSFPFFPACAREEQVEYEQHMKKTLKAAEEWLYSDPLRYQFYPHLVDGMTAVFSSLWTRKTRRRKKGDSHTVTQSFVNVLVAIVGPEVYEFIGRPPSLPDDDAMRVSQILKIYENILNFLIAQGASLCHVSSHYLLNYVDYVTTFDDPKFLRLISKSSLGDELAHSNRMSSSYLFDARSKQCWLDVILQTFKCLVLKRVTADGLREEFCDGLSGNASSTNRLSLVNPLTVTATAIIEDRARANQNYSHQEALLLAWLDYNYEEQRRKDWATNRTYDPSPIESMDVLPERSISNFEDDLSDSLALIAVTVAYCPFLVDEFFTNLYSQPKSTEEVLHNAICVVSAWRKIRLGFMITPREIVRPNCVQMLMLAVHLFETLPTYFPRTKVSFSCCLTETVTRTLNLTNPTDSSVTYVLQIFGNDSALFSTVNSEKTLKLSPRGSGSVNIKFHSRKISRTRSFLLLCGSAMGPNFARNQCFLLEGEATRLGVVKEYKVTSELYNVVDKALSIQVPYDYATNYEIWMSEEMPTKPATIKMERWSDMRLRKVPRRLFLNQTSIIVLEDRREADLSITIACIAPNHRNFWLVFKAKIGDFVIQISSSSEVSITDSITVEWEREACACSDPQTNVVSSCPLNLSVNIPARNVPMWDCVSHMFQKTLNAREQLFWSRHFDTNIGLRLIRRLMGDDSDYTAQEFRHLFESRVTYNVSTSDKSSRLKTAEKLTISDVKLSGEFVEMKIHVDELTPQAYETTLSLESLDGCEKRIYSVDFLCNIPSRSSTSG